MINFEFKPSFDKFGKALPKKPEELETLEIKADQELLQSILRAQEDIQKGRLYSHQDIFKDV